MVTNKAEPKKKRAPLKRVMLSAKNDDFYNGDYEVEEHITLNKFDPSNNSNKFYNAEVHSNSKNEYRYYINHGRVGAKGVEKAEPLATLALAQKKYNTMIKSKLRSGYIEVDVANSATGSSKAQTVIKADALQGITPSNVTNASNTITAQPAKITAQTPMHPTTNHKLHNTPQQPQQPTQHQPRVFHPQLVKFIEHLYVEANQAVSLSMTGSIKKDIRAPLGNLGVKGINKGKELLYQLTQHITARNYGVIEKLSIEYYHNVPRKLPSNLVKDRSWIIDTKSKVSKELDTLDLYMDTLRMLPAMGVSDIETKYNALNSDIRFIDEQASPEDAELMSYINHKINSTHASSHSYKLRVKNAYEVNMKNAPQFDASAGNVVKLFHGSRSANLVGILSSYLKLPYNVGGDVLKTGAMFGSGIYFASDCTKSANYAFGSWQGRPNKHNTAFLMITEVAMGKPYKTHTPHNYSKPPQGYDSVFAQKGSHLINNEFIVYEPNKVRVRYLVEVEKY